MDNERYTSSMGHTTQIATLKGVHKMDQTQASLSNWPSWSQGAFTITGTKPIAKGTPATRGALAVATVAFVGNGLPWFCGDDTKSIGTDCAFHVGMLAYDGATLAFAKAGGILRKDSKAHRGIGSGSKAGDAAAALIKSGFSPTVTVANGMFGVVANGTKASNLLAIGTISAISDKATPASEKNVVPLAYGVPSQQPPKGYSFGKVTSLSLPK